MAAQRRPINDSIGHLGQEQYSGTAQVEHIRKQDSHGACDSIR